MKRILILILIFLFVHSIRAFSGDTIYFDDFSTQSNWIISNNSPNGWEISSTGTSWFFSAPAINSTSGGKYAILLNGDPNSGNPAPIVNGEFILTLDKVLDFRDYNDVNISFLIRGAKFYDKLFLEYSYDGIIYFPVSDVLNNFENLTSLGGSSTGNPEELTFNVSQFVSGQTQVKFRFRYVDGGNGIAYGWIIDDFIVSAGTALDLGVTVHSNPDSVNYGSYMNGWLTPYYSKIPRKQIDNIFLSAYAFNNASQTQYDIIVTSNISNEFGELLYQSISTPIYNLKQGDTISADLGRYPVASNGKHLIDFEISSNDVDENFNNNVYSVSYEITKNTFARDFAEDIQFNELKSYPSDLYNYTQSDYELATNFEFGVTDQIKSVTFMPMKAAGLIQIIIYNSNLNELYSEIVNIEQSDLNNWTTVQLTTPFDVVGSNDVYISLRNNTGTISGVEFANHKSAGFTDKWRASWNNGSLMKLDGKWYGISNVPLIRCNTIDYSNECDAIEINKIITDLTCFASSNGEILISVSGGSAPYSYNWSNGMISEFTSGLNAGIHTVAVSDEQGCTRFKSFEVKEPSEIAISNVMVNDNSFIGSISITVSGGEPPYTYSWTGNGFYNSSVQNPNDIPIKGTYKIDITDSNGCTGSKNVVVSGNVGYCTLSIFISKTEVTAAGVNDGTASLAVFGGKGSLTYLWSTGATTQNIEDLGGGDYSVTVTDDIEIGCVRSAFVTISQPVGVKEIKTNGYNYSIYPNPNKGKFTITIEGSALNNIELIEITNLLGEKVYSKYNQMIMKDGRCVVDVDNIAVGLYFVQIDGISKRIIISK